MRAGPVCGGPDPGRFRTLRAAWTALGIVGRFRALSRRIADVQARLLLTVFYFVVLAPFALGVRALSDPLRLRSGTGPGWLPRPGGGEDPRRAAARQF